jgi:hypothetical protein
MASDPVQTALKTINPLNTPGYMASLLSTYVGPLIERFSSITLGSVYGDVLLNYAVSLLFMISLLLITLTDQASMTSPARTFLLKFHFLFIKSVRAIATIGLFFLGRAIGSSGSFGDGLRVGAPIVTAGFALIFVQRMIDLFVMGVPGQVYFDTPLSASTNTAATYADQAGGATVAKSSLLINVYNAASMVPMIRGTNFGVTLFGVLRSYLSAITEPCVDSLVGFALTYAGRDLTANFVDGMTNTALDNAAQIPNKLRYLWQFQGVDYFQGATRFGTSVFNDQSFGGRGALAEGIWYYSPLFVGIVVGLFK